METKQIKLSNMTDLREIHNFLINDGWVHTDSICYVSPDGLYKIYGKFEDGGPIEKEVYDALICVINERIFGKG